MTFHLSAIRQMTRFSRLLFFIGLLLSCNSETESMIPPESADLLINHTCDSCYSERLIIKDTITSSKGKTKISYPTAIAFFHLLDKIHIYDGNGCQDSMPDKLKHDGRQTIYRTVGQNLIYATSIRPTLDSLKIKIVAGNYQDSTLTFLYQSKPYRVDITIFKDNDGVIFFTPGKKPILWTLDIGSKYCTDRDLVNCYFKY